MGRGAGCGKDERRAVGGLLGTAGHGWASFAPCQAFFPVDRELSLRASV